MFLDKAHLISLLAQHIAQDVHGCSMSVVLVVCVKDLAGGHRTLLFEQIVNEVS
jgi:hypothetical protein